MNRNRILHLTRDGLIVALIAIMTFVPYVGYINIVPASISFTTLHLVVLIAAAVYGFEEALVAGSAFGLFCMIKALAMPTSITDPAFINPLVSVFPRVLFGLAAGLIFRRNNLIASKSKRNAMNIVGVIVCCLIHTVSVLTMYYIFLENKQGTTYVQILLSILSINSAIEIVGALVLVPLISEAIFKARPKLKEELNKKREGRNMRKTTSFVEISMNYHEDLINNLYDFVAIDSVYDETTKDQNNPFGKGVSKALDFIYNLALKDGFTATNYDNMVVEILCGSGSKNITIMAHADVVPAATGWDHDPFQIKEKRGILYGRGVADDKGPLLSSYYALKMLRDNNLLGDYTVRLLVGGNEESGSLGIEHYFHDLKKAQPDFGFSPDSAYPLTYGEKGIIGFNVKYEVKLDNVISMEGGVASNSVIENFKIVLNSDEAFINYLNKEDIKYTYEAIDNNTMAVTFIGKAAHGSMPWLGINAAMIGLKAYGEFYHNEEIIDIVKKYIDPYGKGVKVNAHNDEMFDNSLNVGIVSYENNFLNIVVNFRYINTVTEKEMIEIFLENAKPGTVEVTGTSPLLYYSKDSVLISTLMKAYQEETGDYTSQPMTSGGGTYAKEADNVVAFGMEFPGRDAKMHSPGENVSKQDLFDSIAIYARAIVELGNKLYEN